MTTAAERWRRSTVPGGTGARSSTTSRPMTGRWTNGNVTSSLVLPRVRRASPRHRVRHQPPGRTMPSGFLPGTARSKAGGVGAFNRAGQGAGGGPEACCVVLLDEPSSSPSPARMSASPFSSCSRHRTGFQSSRCGSTPRIITSRSRPAYSRRVCGMATRPCLSGMNSGRRRRTPGPRAAPAPLASPSPAARPPSARTPLGGTPPGSRRTPW